MTNAFKATLAAATVMFSMLSATAGEKIDLPVTIDTVNHTASGAFGSARNSWDSVQSIACVLHSSEFSVDAQCSARNAAGVVRLCNTGNANLISVIQALPSDGYLIFSWNDSAQCTWVHVLNTSFNAPKR
jgi:hypothetical protein